MIYGDIVLEFFFDDLDGFLGFVLIFGDCQIPIPYSVNISAGLLKYKALFQFKFK